MQEIFVYNQPGATYPAGDRARPARAVGVGATHGAKMSSRTDHIYDRIYAAIVEQVLRPGTKLGEEALCGVFGVSRTLIRRVLHRLASEHVVELLPNRGAFVARPSIAEARDVFAARRVVEAGVVAALAGQLSEEQAARLRRQIALERAAHDAGDRRGLIRLSGAFHVLLAELAGNPVIVRFLRELVSRTALIIAVYEAPGVSYCSPDEHAALVTALARGSDRAHDAMRRHLEGIEVRLDLDRPRGESGDLRQIFADQAPGGPAPPPRVTATRTATDARQ
jgi:DNA-binding GntR family transcriptional regulator